MPPERLDGAARRFVAQCRVAHLATANAAGAPHVVPVCFGVVGDTVYIAIDEKPKSGVRLKRLRNIADNPAVALVVDRYDEDWTRLGWVMLRGAAEVLPDGAEHDAAQAMLGERYPQLAKMAIAGLPVIAIRVARVTQWGAV